jgi:hypothetical protein
MLQDRGVTGVFRRFAMSPIRRDVRQTHPTGCQHETDRSKSQMVTRTAGQTPSALLISFLPFIFFRFFGKARTFKSRDRTVCYWGPHSRVRPWCQNTVQVKRQGLLTIWTQTLDERERERGDLSLGCVVVYLYGIRVTDVGGKFFLFKRFFFSTRDPVWVEFFCLSLLYVSIWLCYAIVLCSVWSWPTQGNFISIYDQVGQIDRLYMSIDSSSSYIKTSFTMFCFSLPHSQSINTFWKNSFKLSYGTWEELSRGLSSSIFYSRAAIIINRICVVLNIRNVLFSLFLEIVKKDRERFVSFKKLKNFSVTQ